MDTHLPRFRVIRRDLVHIEFSKAVVWGGVVNFYTYNYLYFYIF
jgi:hypothetical protein